MGVREIDRSLEQWQMGVKDLRRRDDSGSHTPGAGKVVRHPAAGWQMGLNGLAAAAKPPDRHQQRTHRSSGAKQRVLVVQGLTAAATAEALERDPHTIGRWASAFGEGGPAALIFEQTGGSPPPLTRRSRRS